MNVEWKKEEKFVHKYKINNYLQFFLAYAVMEMEMEAVR